MTAEAKIILNPYAGRWQARRCIAAVQTALEAVGLAYDLAVTEAPGQSIDLARQASLDGWPLVVAAGGDGTISEVVNGLVQAAGGGEAGPLGIIALGSANDLATILGLPGDIGAACRRLAAGQTRLIDVGLVNNHCFDNNSAVGLEPVVSIENMKIKHIKGTLRYVIAALRGIWQARSWHMRLQWDDGEYEGSITLVSVGNSPRTGGAFWMTPQAELDDGYLDFVFAPAMSRWQQLRLLPLTFSGAHVHHPLVTQARTRRLQITSSPPTPIQADGEVIARGATDIAYTLLPKKLRVIV
ncbi:MAG: diacylglycerol/lipid kinase family protein [Anaerolineae bacterium]